MEVWADGLDDLGPAHDGTDGEAIADTLSHHDEVGLDVEGIDAPEVGAGAPEARLDLVGDQEYPPLVQDLLYPLEVAGRRLDKPAHLLYDRAHVVGAAEVAPALMLAEPATQGVGILRVRHVQCRARGRAPVALARYAHRRERAAVVGAAKGYDLARVPVARGEEERCLVRLTPAHGKKGFLLTGDRGELYESFG